MIRALFATALIVSIVGCVSSPQPPLIDLGAQVTDSLPALDSRCEFPDVDIGEIDGREVIYIDAAEFTELETCENERVTLLGMQAEASGQYLALQRQYNALLELVRLRYEISQYQMAELSADRREGLIEIWILRAALLATVL